MSNSKISALTAATTPLAGTETLPVVQSSTTKQVSVANLTAGRVVSVLSLGANNVASPATPIQTSEDASYNGLMVSSSRFSGSGTANLLTNVLIGRGADNVNYPLVVLHHNDGTARTTQVSIQTALLGVNSDKLLIDQNGNITANTGNFVIGTSGKGIDFSITPDPSGMTSELLADYEEGTWTPVIGGDGGTSGQSYSTQNGKYVKVGKLVTVSCDVRLSTKGTITGNVILSGLPYTVTSGDYYGGGTANLIQNLGAATSMVAFHAIPSSTTAYAQKSNNNTSSAYMATADITNTTWFFITMSYIST